MNEKNHHYILCDDSYESTDTTPGYRHYRCTDPGFENEEYSYKTDPLVYERNPKTGEAANQHKAVNPYLPNYELLPDNELCPFWSKKDQEWRVYVTGSHDSLLDGRWCGNEVVCWSAPVYDLSDWRYEGVTRDGGWFFACDFAYDLKTDRAVFYAFPFFTNPGMDSTHLWTNGTSDPAAYFDRPFCGAGVTADACNLSGQNGNPVPDVGTDMPGIKGIQGIHGIDDTGWNFDPAILIEDNGNVTLVWDVQATDDAPKHCQMTRLNDDRTEILWSIPIQMAEGEPNSAGFNPDDYEANTLNYIPEFEAYVLQYSYVMDPGPSDGKGYYPLAYLYTFDKDLEHAKWHWGGIISDNSGRYTKDLKTGKIADCGEAAYSWDNNHGGLVKINGKWYISNHRHTGKHACRQGFLAEVHMRKEGEKLIIEPTEFTSSISGSLDAYEGVKGYKGIPAYTACHITPAQNYSLQEADGSYIHPTTYIKAVKGEGEKDNGFVYDDPAYALHRSPIVGICKGSVIGWKYLDFGEPQEEEFQVEIRLLVTKDPVEKVEVFKPCIDGHARVWLDAPTAEKGGKQIAEFDLSGENVLAAQKECTDSGKISWSLLKASTNCPINGQHAVYLVFDSTEEGAICALDEIRFCRFV